MEKYIDYRLMSNEVTNGIFDYYHNYLPSSLDDVSLELNDDSDDNDDSDYSDKIITIHNLHNSIDTIYTCDILIKKFPKKLKDLYIDDTYNNFIIKRLPKGFELLAIKPIIINLRMRLAPFVIN